jgi:hypothetical protein
MKLKPNSLKKPRFEYELFLPIKTLLKRQGFHVQGEVQSLDILAIKDNETIAVELKLAVNLKLIYQAVDRLKIADYVYVALPHQVIQAQQQYHQYFLGLLRKLEIGLISVQGDQAFVVLEAKSFLPEQSQKRNLKRRASLIKEFLGRGDSEQTGGVQGKRMTAYRLRVMKLHQAMQPQTLYTAKQLKQLTGVEDAYAILHHNYYGWFKKVKRGHYALVDVSK